MKLRILAAACATVLAAGFAQAQTSGLELSNFDTSVRVQDDFNQYVNGGWMKKTEIPGDKSRWGAFSVLTEQAANDVLAVVQDAVKNPGKPGSETAKVADLYKSFMNEKAREAAGFAPLKPTLAKIAAAKDKKDLAVLFAELRREGVKLPFTLTMDVDVKAPKTYAVNFSQSGLGMPDRDYYLKDDDQRLKDIRAKYQKHVEAMLTLAGDKSAAAHAADILDLETELAKVQWSRVENRDPVKTYNRVDVAKMDALAPGFDWVAHLKAAGMGKAGDFVTVDQPSYLTGMAALVRDIPLETWKQYLNFRTLAAYAGYLNKAAVAEDFAFNSQVIRGVKEQEKLDKLAVAVVNAQLGDVVGKQYVARYFPPENKARMDKLVASLLDAFKDGIDELQWMSPATKKEAQAKLAGFKPYIGYPDKWKDYSKVTTKPDDLVGNLRSTRLAAYQRNLERIGKPVDRDEWARPPQTVNAWYSPDKNTITFPAAILQPPFFNVKADDAVNYGAIVAVIGHEVGHGFDDQGSQFDAEGNLRNWWTEEDRKQFEVRADMLVKQYSAMSPIPGYFVNGKLTLGENIGDNSGLAVAYKAYKKSLGGKPSPVIDGYTGEQRFFLGFGQIWRNKSREETTLTLLKSDTHSPADLRAPGALVNQPGFYEAFGVKEGDKMYLAPEKRAIIW